VRCLKDVTSPQGSINYIDCGSATNNGTLTSGAAANGVSSLLPYTGGNGGTHNGQTVTSTGVTGLTATLAAGTFANGTGSLTYTITGTPSASGTASFALNIGGQSCTLTRTVGLPAVSITGLNCASATNNGTLTSGTAASGVNSVVPYTGGNGVTHNGQTVTSTGVTGLTATLAAGTFANGTGSLTYTITGTPSSSSTASFVLSIGGQSCTLSINVLTASSPAYSPNSVFCANGPTSVVDVTNPATGEIWMDRNLGATQAATSSNDTNSYGDLYQWGRRSDGHQCRTSPTTSILSSTDQPGHGDFISVPVGIPYDWRSPQNNNLWQYVNGINNPCPSGYRLPTEAELETERLSWSSNNAQGAFASALKLPLAGGRDSTGSLNNVGNWGIYWSSTVINAYSQFLFFNSSWAFLNAGLARASGLSVRCLKDVSSPQGSINTINCGSATNNGTLTSGTAASWVSSIVPYTGGNGGTHNGQTVASTGVTGLTATLAAGTFANGAGSLTYTISGTPSASGTASFALNIGGQSCTLTRTIDLPVGSLVALNCASATNNGTLTSGTAASGVSSLVPYTGGNGGTHNGQTVTSTGVTGLTATLAAGAFANGTGSVTYTISGTPSASGTASFALSIGGQSCNLNLTVNNAGGSGTYPPNSVFCSGIPTVIIDVTNPITGEIWMDRNLGATQVATSSTDANAYGDLYQWGRRSDGHQCRTSATTTTLSSTDQPANGNFILVDNSPDDWRSPQNNNLWQGVNGVNNPCPSGYRLPTEAELETERLSWSSNNAQGAFASALKLPVAGFRFYSFGGLFDVGAAGYYWSSSVNGVFSQGLLFSSGTAGDYYDFRATGLPVRCLKD
jgi:uncharacterized protein (TIGR02145 family)